MPIETAHEIAAALADYVGDPALTAPLTAAGMHAEPELEPVPEPDPDATQHAFGPALDPEATQRVAAPQSDPEATQQVAAPQHDPEATQQVAAPATDNEPSHSTLADEDDGTDENGDDGDAGRHAVLPSARRRLRGPGTAVPARRRGRTALAVPGHPRATAVRLHRATGAGGRPRRSVDRSVVTVVHAAQPRQRGLPAGLRRERWGRRDAGHRSRTRVLALRGQPGGGQRRPHRQGGPRLAADGDRDRRTPRAGGGRGDRLQPRSPGRRAPDGLGTVPGALELRAGPGLTRRAGRRTATSIPWPSRRRRTPTRRPTRSTATPPPPGPRAPTAATPRSVASSPASG